MKMLAEAHPETFSDIVKISGLAHGTYTWNGNAAELIKDGVCALSDVIAPVTTSICILRAKALIPNWNTG